MVELVRTPKIFTYSVGERGKKESAQIEVRVYDYEGYTICVCWLRLNPAASMAYVLGAFRFKHNDEQTIEKFFYEFADNLEKSKVLAQIEALQGDMEIIIQNYLDSEFPGVHDLLDILKVEWGLK